MTLPPAAAGDGGGAPAAARPDDAAEPARPADVPRAGGEDAALAQKLNQLQLFRAVFPQESVGRLASFGPA